MQPDVSATKSDAGIPADRKRSSILEFLIPPGRPADRRFWPRSLWSRVALIVCVLAVGAYLFFWVKGHWAVLTDTNLQTDDARTALFPFHRYDDGAPLENDPVANEMIGFTPPALRLLYAGLVKSSNLFVAMKVVQAICFSIVLLSGIWLARRRRAGWAAGALLVFLIFHTRGLVGGTIGGMTRGFVVPILTVWTAGVIGGSKRLRYGAVILGALTHPSVMALLLATEGILALRLSRGFWRDVVFRKSLLQYGVLVLLCLCIAIPYSKDQERRVGRPFTVEEAEKEGCLGPGGRARHLPFGDPTSSAAKRFIAIFGVDDDKEDDRPGLSAGKPVPGAFEAFKKLDNTGALLLFAGIFALGVMRLSPIPRAAAALFAATFITYWMARVFAFRMYAPARFFQYGMPFISILIAVAAISQIAPRLRRSSRDLLRVGVVCLLGCCLIAWTGDGIVPRNGVSLDRRHDREMYDFVATLPTTIRVATHPSDGDDLPLFAARATVCGFETLQPWWVDRKSVV